MRISAARIGVIATLTAATAMSAVAALAQTPTPETREVVSGDNFFDPEAVHVGVGTRIVWPNVGQTSHTVTATDGTFESGDLRPGQEFARTFDRAGAYRYFCRYHGTAGGQGMAGVILVGNARLQSPSGHQSGRGAEKIPTEPGETLLVPKDFGTIQRAVNAADPGDLIVVSPGVYQEGVKVTTPYITIRGRNRNSVILDGGFNIPNGIHVIEADGVAIENMTARHYRLNGFIWTSVLGYRGSFLTAYNNGDYGIYAFDSRYGRFEHSYASGHPDAGFYIGQCHPCDAVVTRVVSERNGLGFSGTNAGGNLKVVNSVWRNNMAGILPNTLDSERLAPQRQIYVAGNLVVDNNNVNAPANALTFGALGNGILVAGGAGDVVERNTVLNHRNYGIGVSPNADRNLWIAERNVVRNNTVRGSGLADLALGGPGGRDNCFSSNDFASSVPPAIETLYGCGSRLASLGGGDLAPTVQSLASFLRGKSGKFPHGDWRSQPAPSAQRSMRDPLSAPPLTIPGVEVPGEVSRLRAHPLPDSFNRMEVNVLGIPLAAPTWWALLLGMYAYILPLALYVTWVAIAVWDLVRRDERNSFRIAWMIVIFAVPFLGPVLYYVWGRTEISRSVRIMLVVGGPVVAATFTVVAVAFAS
ncbi:MAG TPA: right-handed parallel beta-helix repeat-containing protein [Actinomycetota bacterium]|nr:right-handed parallel beta-helix repeat-containing protein [Actinomycetota bacterium]